MRAYHDVIGAIDERSSERMSFRTKPRVKETIQKAAALSRVDVSTFTMNAAYKAAMNTIFAHEQTTLRAIDHETLFAAIDRASAPTDKLRNAFARHKTTITQR